MHSVWSDGSEPLESIADACLVRGHRCAGMTDHSYGLSIAGGMTMEQVAQQHAAIDALNSARKGRFRMFKGIEANIPLGWHRGHGAARAAPV
jgi:histidinol phosphatase-like PHP family hydrolase